MRLLGLCLSDLFAADNHLKPQELHSELCTELHILRCFNIEKARAMRPFTIVIESRCLIKDRIACTFARLHERDYIPVDCRKASFLSFASVGSGEAAKRCTAAKQAKRLLLSFCTH